MLIFRTVIGKCHHSIFNISIHLLQKSSRITSLKPSLWRLIHDIKVKWNIMNPYYHHHQQHEQSNWKDKWPDMQTVSLILSFVKTVRHFASWYKSKCRVWNDRSAKTSRFISGYDYPTSVHTSLIIFIIMRKKENNVINDVITEVACERTWCWPSGTCASPGSGTRSFRAKSPHHYRAGCPGSPDPTSTLQSWAGGAWRRAAEKRKTNFLYFSTVFHTFIDFSSWNWTPYHKNVDEGRNVLDGQGF